VNGNANGNGRTAADGETVRDGTEWNGVKTTSGTNEFAVICLCAAWCGTCREYRPAFDALAARFPEVAFRWVDIEDEADAIGDIDVENFPTLLLRRGEWVLFYGTMLPHIGHLQRLLETFIAQTPAESRDYALADGQRARWQTDADLGRL